MKLSQLITSGLITAILLTTSGCIIHVGGDRDDYDGDHSSIFGGVDISDNRHVEDLSSVNGSISVGNEASAEDVDTVNGDIELGYNVQIRSASTVNGDIEALEGLSVDRDMATVNGEIDLKNNSTVGQDVSTVNGDISLDGTKVGEDMETKNGDISLVNNSVVEGDIVFKSRDKDRWGNGNHSVPTLTIDGSSKVKGRIILERKVILEIANDDLLAKVERNYQP